MSLTVTDIFAGAGGSSTGMVAVPGVEIRTAANHLQLAVDVHNANHPTTEHMCVDLHLEDPRNFPRTEILWASPECTKWSIANNKAKALSAEMGGDPTLFDDVPDELETDDHDEATRSRLLMFDVLRFIEHHRYRYVIVENVVDIATQAKYRQAWESWQRGLRKLGYAYRVVSLNSMHAQAAGDPAPQSRDRLYVVAWPANEKAPDIDRALSPAAWCYRCDQVVQARQAWKNGRTVGRYRAQYVYACSGCGTTVEPGWLPAASAIDWTLPGRRIGDRSKPLADKTRARIAAGIARYWRPFTLTTHDRYALVTRHYGIPGGDAARHTTTSDDALRTLTGNAGNMSLLMRNNTGGAEMLTPTVEPMRTLTTAGHKSLITPGDLAAAEAQVDDCLFRMLEPHEVAAGMAFPSTYIWAGKRRDRVKLMGNAVTPPAARDLMAVLVESLGGAA